MSEEEEFTADEIDDVLGADAGPASKKRKLLQFLAQETSVSDEYLPRDMRERLQHQAELELKGKQSNAVNEDVAQNLISLFSNPTTSNYLDALLLLTRLWPGYNEPIRYYVQQSQKQDNWYQDFVRDDTAYARFYFSETDEITKFIIWIAKNLVMRYITNMGSNAESEMDTNIVLGNREFKTIAQKAYRYYFSEELSQEDIKDNTALMHLISDISHDLFIRTLINSSTYASGSALRSATKYLTDNGINIATAKSSKLYQALTRNYEIDPESEQTYGEADASELMVDDEYLPPTSTLMSGLQLRLRLA